MDEPTTHLDLASVDALIEALKQYQGTLVFISHDVHFIRALSTHVVRVGGGPAPAFRRRLPVLPRQDGAVGARGVDKFELQQQCVTARTSRAAPQVDRKEQKRIEAEQRQARSRKKQEIQKRIAALEKEIAKLEAQGTRAGGGTGEAGNLSFRRARHADQPRADARLRPSGGGEQRNGKMRGRNWQNLKRRRQRNKFTTSL